MPPNGARTDSTGRLRPIWEDDHDVVLVLDGGGSAGAVRVETLSGRVEAIRLDPKPRYRPCLTTPLHIHSQLRD